MNAKNILRGTLVLGLLAGTALAADPIQVKVQPKNKRAASPVRPVGRTDDQTFRSSQALNLTGRLEVTRGSVTLNGRKLLLTSKTSVFPHSEKQRMPELKSLNGQNASAFGRMTPDGIEITLLVLQDPTKTSTSSQADLQKAYIQPTDGGAGVLKPGAPH